ncbi:MAG: hypothetical protein ABJ205_05845 [Erythrobacter sp.]|uniref:hypothetical protein n=1 Tax=Erythrobacter sp. TaxID=1042 RepID=UPI003266F394
MFDPPPEVPSNNDQVIIETDSSNEVQPHLPTDTQVDGVVVIDLSSLGPPADECLGYEPDPFNPEIVVCREVALSPRLDPTYGSSSDELIEGSAVPRAQVQLSEDVEAEANVTNSGVGGWKASGGEVKARIKF